LVFFLKPEQDVVSDGDNMAYITEGGCEIGENR